ncbi:MAG: TonB-dependent receptor [Ignavibacteriae bacterium]|nr:TonB-dependent receptor [Ignavibacteriota bacterium]
MNSKFRKILNILSIIILCSGIVYAQTTGKIAGKVIEKSTGEPLLGANVIIPNTNFGAATNIEGEFYIINISPGKYNLKVSMVGYADLIFKDLEVSVNRTTNLTAELSAKDVALDEIVVSVDASSEKKDQTSSIKNISGENIKMLPVENIGDVVNLQAGVVQGHFRGGRNTEVSYMVDGVSISDSYTKDNYKIEIETEAVQDMEVITGTFNAEYGKAMSGIVNIVTKEGSNKFHGSISSALSNYYTSNTDIFYGLKTTDITRNQDYKLQLEGPIYGDAVTFFTNFRFQDNEGYLNGINRFQVDNYTDFTHSNILNGKSTPWDAVINGGTYYSEHTGDNSYIPTNWMNEYSVMGKITIKPFTSIKFSTMYSKNYSEHQRFGGGDYAYKYKPTGRRTYYEDSDFYLFQLNHIITNSMFHDLKFSYRHSLSDNYLYKDPFDPRYIADNYGTSGGGFITGGQDKGYNGVELNDINIKYDLTWQVNTNHSIKTGFDYSRHDLAKSTVIVRDIKYGSADQDYYHYDSLTNKIVFNEYEPEILSTAVTSDNYNKKPFEYSAYIQDKMEYEDLVINFGLRYDYFNSNTIYPTQLRNPANQLSYPSNPERMSEYPMAESKKQISPRFGLSYTLGSAAVLHFSYGHFFQMPPLFALYQNSRFLIPTGNFETVLGNPNLNPEKTVQYEMGLWYELQKNLGMEVSVFYRDIYDLLTAVVVTTYNQVKYGYYSNKDYGNVKGMELKFDYTFDEFTVFLNYTLQYTRGISDNPTSTFTRAGQNMDEISKLIALEWDQRHTLNLSVNYAHDNFGMNLTGTYNSGIAYTYKPISESPLSKQTLFPNNQHRPATFDLSLKGYYDFTLSEHYKLRLFANIYNVLDRLNEVLVNEITGRAYTTILTESEKATFKSNYNDYYDTAHDPSMFSAPREIKIGIGLFF